MGISNVLGREVAISIGKRLLLVIRQQDYMKFIQLGNRLSYL